MIHGKEIQWSENMKAERMGSCALSFLCLWGRERGEGWPFWKGVTTEGKQRFHGMVYEQLV